MKIYTDEREVPYKNTNIDPIKSKMDIDGLLARWGIRDVAWRWDLKNNNIFVTFQIEESIEERLVKVVVNIEPPRIWNRANRRGTRKEEINWAVSMRVMHWWLKTHLEMNYLSMSDKTTAFLPYIIMNQKSDGQYVTVRDILLSTNNLEKLKALPQPDNDKIIDVEATL